jgi:hypothetical protein
MGHLFSFCVVNFKKPLSGNSSDTSWYQASCCPSASYLFMSAVYLHYLMSDKLGNTAATRYIAGIPNSKTDTYLKQRQNTLTVRAENFETF